MNESENLSPKTGLKRKRPHRRLSAADRQARFASVRPRAWERFASGMSLRAVARAEGVSRSAIERLAKREGWAAERKRLRAAETAEATERASRRIAERLALVKDLGLDVRIAGLKRVRKIVGRKRIDGQEAQALRDLSTVAKNLDLQAEAARASIVAVQNNNTNWSGADADLGGHSISEILLAPEYQARKHLDEIRDPDDVLDAEIEAEAKPDASA